MHFVYQLNTLAWHLGGQMVRPRRRNTGSAEILDVTHLDRAAESRLTAANLLKEAGANFLPSACLINQS